MKTIILNILAIIVGLVLGSVVNMALVMTGPHVFPLPSGINVNDAESLKTSGHLLQAQHFVFPFLAHAGGTLVGALVANLIAVSRRAVFSYVIGGLFLAGGIAAATMIPAPDWFLVLDLLGAYLPMAWLATCLGRKLRSTAK